ncbi:thiol-activated cytolysin family protein [Chitinophaga vietnamensis]|uniref:thiol-activated cytolysin family protein n=1 Tax=Chitinophaga vietnamensis TaxID=2593957 RepID=UPI0011779769|nr:thiol-activated cytolysin family protein [Chitinophaga vietnamensis]
MLQTWKLPAGILVAALLLNACTKKINVDPVDGKNASDAPYSFRQLKKFGDTIITIRTAADQADLKALLDARKMNTGQFLRDSIWPYNTGYSRFYEADEQVVVPNNETLIYPGSLIRGTSINSDNFVPLPIRNYKRYPIKVYATFPSDLSVAVIDTPSLSRTRIFLRQALTSPGFSGGQLESFLYETFKFSYYDEIKEAYGYNVNVKGLFYSSSSSFNFSAVRSEFPTAIIAKFTMKNFSIVLDAPADGKLVDETNVDKSVLYGYSPVYVNTVTYGRMGIVVAESNFQSDEVKSAFEKTIKKLFGRTTESLTDYEKTLVNSARINIYLIGGSGAPVTQAVNGYDQFVNYIFHSTTFSAADPGVPISFTMRYLSDNTPVKTVFRLDYPN